MRNDSLAQGMRSTTAGQRQYAPEFDVSWGHQPFEALGLKLAFRDRLRHGQRLRYVKNCMDFGRLVDLLYRPSKGDVVACILDTSTMSRFGKQLINYSFLSSLFLLAILGCTQQTDPEPTQTLLSRVETFSINYFVSNYTYDVSSPKRRRYYTDFEYDGKARLIGIKQYMDAVAPEPKLLYWYTLLYGQDGKVSKMTKYDAYQAPGASITYTAYTDVVFSWSATKLVASSYYPASPTEAPILTSQFTYDLNESGFPIRQSKPDGTVVSIASFDPNGNMIECRTVFKDTTFAGTKNAAFDLNRFDPYSGSYVLRLYRSLLGNSAFGLYHSCWFSSRNWVLQRSIGNNSASANPELIVTSNAAGYPTETEQPIEFSEQYQQAYPWLSHSTLVHTFKYSYITK